MVKHVIETLKVRVVDFLYGTAALLQVLSFEGFGDHAISLFPDALDECGKDNAIRLVDVSKSLLESLTSQPEGPGQFRICFSRR